MRKGLTKAVMLGTLALTQTVGTVSLIQNSIVSVYAEQKNKDITSQEFLDYIKDLKQKYPNFKFEESTQVYRSMQEAKDAELAQKNQIAQSIKQYEDEKKQSKDEYDAKVNKYNQDVAAYNQAKQEWDAKKAELESKKTEEGQLTETLAQNLIFKDEPNAEVSVSGNFQGYWKRSDNRYGNDYGNVDYKPESGDTLEQSWTGGYATWKASNDNFLGLPIVLSQGDSVTATYTNLQNSSYAGKKISKIEYTISSNQTQPHSVFVLKNPALGLWTYNTKEGNNTVQTNLTMKFYDEDGNLIEFDEAHPALVNMGSLNSGTTASGYRYVEKVYNQNFRFVPINGSLIKESANHEIYAVDEDTDNPTNYKGLDSTKWDRIGNPNMWFGSGTGVVTSGNTISLSAESNASGQWLIVNGAVTTKDVLPPLLATYPDALEPHHDPDYSGNNGTRNAIYYSRVLVRQLTTEWVDKEGKELKTPVTDTSTKPAGDIEHYSFVESRTDDDGNVTHVFRQYTTKWVDESGTELKDMVTDKDTKEHGTIQDYSYVNSETDNNGNVTHIFRQYTTKWVDGDNRELKPLVKGDSVKEHGDIPDYAYVTTNTDERGNVTHVFRQYITEWVDEDGNSLKDSVKGSSTVEKGNDIKDYKFVESKTDEKGNVKHIFKQFTTKWVTTSLEDLDKPVKTDEFKDSKTFENYQFVETREVGNTRTHIYRPYETTWIEEGTNKELKKDNKLVKEHGEIKSYTFVRTEVKDNGDIVHIYKKVEQKKEQKKDDIPTGVHTNSLISMFMILISSIGLALTSIRKKRDE